MNVESSVAFQPAVDLVVFVCAVVVDDHVYLHSGVRFLVDLPQEAEEFLMPMARHTFSNDMSGSGIQSGKQSGRAVALVVMSLACRNAWPQGKKGLSSFEGLNLTLLVDAQDECSIRRVKVKADNICEFLNESGILAELEGFQDMGFQLACLPDALNRHSADVLGFGHGARTPMGLAWRCGFERSLDDGPHLPCGQLGFATWSGGVLCDSCDPFLSEPVSPQLHGWARDAEFGGDVLVLPVLSSTQDNLRSLGQSLGNSSTIGRLLERLEFVRSQFYGCCYSHSRVYHENAHMASDLWDTTLEVESSWFYGPGHIDLNTNSLLTITGDAPGNPPSVIRSNITGTGNIQIDIGQELRIENGAVVDLSGTEPEAGCSNCPSSDPSGWGTITIDGSLIVRDSTVRNTNVEVTLAEFEGATGIINNDIRLVEATTGYGGQFFVSGSSTIECNTVVSEGDRYLDLDPDPSIPLAQRPVICNNRFSVIIKQGVDNTQGTVLELRSHDHDCDPLIDSNGCPSGAFELSGGDGFDVDINTWVLEQLEILEDAKLNLTDRQGFEFNTNGAPETVYVKNLILHPDAVLNTALQRMYYQSIEYIDTNGQPIDVDTNGDPVEDNGSTITDVPLLGFSLGIIAMEDDTEFAVRVRTRLRDPNDQQPPACDQTPSTCLEGLITREEGLLPAGSTNGVMDMRTQADDRQPATSVAAKGAFARAGDENILVAFEYKFVEDPGGDAELVVYLSDEPDVGDSLVELARVRPPADDRPGSLSSSAMAVFQGTFPRGQLNFTRGTYVELELRGQGTRVWIDNWDPQIECLSCGDLNGTGLLDNGDFLVLLSEYGRDTASHGGGATAHCLDVGFNNDGYVDLGDLMAWDAILSGSLQANNFCDTPFGAGRRAASTNGTVTLPPPNSLFVAGKPGTGGDQQDFLYTIQMAGTNGTCGGAAQAPASVEGLGGHRNNGRLVRDAAGEIYQLHTLQGLVRLSDGAQIIEPGADLPVQSAPSLTASVGITESEGGNYAGVPLGDAAFDPTDDSVVFVVPVLVSSSGFRYRAAAKLKLLGGGTYVVERLYGKNPHTYSTIEPVEDLGELIGFVYEPDRQRLREIEVDAEGKVYVTSAQEVGANDWVLVYDEALGNASERAIDISAEVAGPTSLLVSSLDDKLYLSSSVNASSSGLTRVYRYTIDRGAGNPPDLTLDGHLAIDNPTTNGFNNYNNGPCGHVASVTSIQEDPNDGTLYVVGFTAPKVADDLSTTDPRYGQLFGTESSMLATPTLAVIPASVNGPVLPGDSNPVPAAPINCDTLSLPLSAVFVPGIGISGDCDNDGDVDAADYACFVNCLAGPAVIVASACTPFDFDSDQDVDLRDFAAFTVIGASPVPGDCDHDGDVDAGDISCFVGCLVGPDQAPPGGCASIDFDGDNDVDLVDFAAFQAASSGA